MQIDIYAIYNDVNGKIYVGQTRRGYKKRFKEHLSQNEACPLVKSAVKKYGAGAFHVELLDVAFNETEANLLEKLWIKALKIYQPENGYNLSMGGVIGHFNKEVIQKMKTDRQGKRNPFYGKQHTEESRKRMSESKKGKYQNSRHPRAKKVICIETGEIFGCIKEAAKIKGINRPHISQACRKQYGRKTAGGYHWEYVKEIADSL